MNCTEYQTQAHEFAAYPKDRGPQYVCHALIEELGELHGVVAKALRKGIPPQREAILLEAGDLLWQIAEAATLLGVPLTNKAPTTRSLWLVEEVAGLFLRLKEWDVKGPSPEVAFATRALEAYLHDIAGYSLEAAMKMNITKLTDRRARGVIVGEGDKR